MITFGLIGYPLTHSKSAEYFLQEFHTLYPAIIAEYKLFPMKNIENIRSWISKQNNLLGFNVTSPFKIQIIPFLDQMDTSAIETESVNTVKIFRTNNKIYLKGYNTDITGFKYLLTMNQQFPIKKALIIGTGGASKSVSHVLSSKNIEHLFVSRNPKNINTIYYSQVDKDIISTHNLIINTTPLGQFPNVTEYPPLPFGFFTCNTIIIDLIYNPEKTLLLQKAEKQRAKISNGLFMLHQQAKTAWNIWLENC